MHNCARISKDSFGDSGGPFARQRGPSGEPFFVDSEKFDLRLQEASDDGCRREQIRLRFRGDTTKKTAKPHAEEQIECEKSKKNRLRKNQKEKGSNSIENCSHSSVACSRSNLFSPLRLHSPRDRFGSAESLSSRRSARRSLKSRAQFS